MPLQTVQITTFGTQDTTSAAAWKALAIAGAGRSGVGQPQTCRLMVSTDASSGTFTLEARLCDPDGCYAVRQFTCTITAGRVGRTGASGEYLCTVSDGGRDCLDLLGADGSEQAAGRRWYVGVPGGAAAGATSVSVAYDWTRVV